ncbi:MAG TPA: NUDIX hydrolase [Patescibacteria group bacterium]|nr:NUDIX hydrolase [Patescibacteria group bacterium]
MRTIQRDIVGAFIFSNDNHILLGKSGDGGVYQGVWVVPGGGIEPGETLLQAMKRETMEEVGLELTDAVITPLTDEFLTGKSEKTLKDGERVMVEMRFHDFVVKIPHPAADTPIDLQDDLGEASWLPIGTLDSLKLAPGVAYRLRKLGYLS